MYLDFYGLREKPFNTTPDPRFLFLTPSHREALGPADVRRPGRHGLCRPDRRGRNRQDDVAADALAAHGSADRGGDDREPDAGFDGVLELILEDLGIGKDGDTTAQRLVALHRHLLERAAAGQRTVVIIDEAQHLEPATLEQIRLLSNYESPSRKLLQIILAGQPELEDKLALPQLRQLRQRIGLRCVIEPLTSRETRDYVTARLRVAKAANPRLFTDRALDRISKYSRGIPRLINIVCEHSLLIGYADQIRQIDHGVVKEAIRTIEAHEHSGTRWRTRWWKLHLAGRRWLLGAGVAAVASTVGGAVWYTRGASALGDVVSTYGARVLYGVEAILRP